VISGPSKKVNFSFWRSLCPWMLNPIFVTLEKRISKHFKEEEHKANQLIISDNCFLDPKIDSKNIGTKLYYNLIK